MDTPWFGALVEAIRAGRLIVGRHAQRKMRQHSISIADIEAAVTTSEVEVIEDYPYEPRGHCCLVVGWVEKRAIHLVVSLPPRPFLVTTYWPDSQPHKWSADFRRRRV